MGSDPFGINDFFQNLHKSPSQQIDEPLEPPAEKRPKYTWTLSNDLIAAKIVFAVKNCDRLEIIWCEKFWSHRENNAGYDLIEVFSIIFYSL